MPGASLPGHTVFLSVTLPRLRTGRRRSGPLRPDSRLGPPLPGTAEPVLPGHRRARGGKRRPSTASPLPSRSAPAPTSLAHRGENDAPARAPPPQAAPPAGPPAPRGAGPPWPQRGSAAASPRPCPVRTDLLGGGRRHLAPPPPLPPLREGRGRPLVPLREPGGCSPRPQALPGSVTRRSRAGLAPGRCPTAPRYVTVAPPPPRRPSRHHRGCKDPRTRPSPEEGHRAGRTISVTSEPPEERSRTDKKSTQHPRERVDISPWLET